MSIQGHNTLTCPEVPYQAPAVKSTEEENWVLLHLNKICSDQPDSHRVIYQHSIHVLLAYTQKTCQKNSSPNLDKREFPNSYHWKEKVTGRKSHNIKQT